MKTVLLFIVGLAFICLGGDKLVDAAVAIARKLGIPQLIVGATIVSLGTTLPEILVSTTAAFSGSGDISVGNAFGSIICNTALIAGLTQTLKPAKSVETASMKWQISFFFVALIVVEACGLVFGVFSRPLGILLLLAFCVFAWLNIKEAKGGESVEEDEKTEDVNMAKQLITLIVCAVLLYFGAKLLVDNGILIAQAIGVPERVIAVTFIALGTSLPELITSVMSIIKGYANVGIGNIIGANLLNMLLVVGIPAAITGITVARSSLMIDIPLSAGVMALLFIPMIIRKKSSRVQGVLLLVTYCVYCVASF